MKLLIDAHCFDFPTSEGVNSYLRGLYQAIIPQAKDIKFYIADHDIDKVKSIFGTHANLSYIQLSGKSKLYRLLLEFPKIIKRYNIDAAHYQYTCPLYKNCKNIITLHDILFKDFPELFPWNYRIIKGILFKLSAKRADLLLTVSKYSQDRISTHFNIAKDKIFITPNAVDNDFYTIDQAKAQSFVLSQGITKYLLYVSRIEPRKNQVALLKAYLDLKLWLRDYSLVFIGRKTLPTEEFDKLLRSLSPEQKQNIHILNQVDFTELKYWYKAASVFVYPALAEGFGIPALEAGASGIPCICNNATAMKDYKLYGENLIDINDSNALKERIIDCLSNDYSIELQRINQIIHQTYNWSKTAKHFYDLVVNL